MTRCSYRVGIAQRTMPGKCVLSLWWAAPTLLHPSFLPHPSLVVGSAHPTTHLSPLTPDLAFMKSHLKFQSLAFYGVAISSVLLLFKVVTAYGEANVKASAPVEGRYPLSLQGSISQCSSAPNLVLNIQQSGVYLNGSLVATQTNSQDTLTAAEKPALTGRFKQGQLLLSGKVPSSTLCSNSAASDVNSVTIQAQPQGESLAGQLALNNMPQAVKFTALREEPAESNQNSSSH